MPGSQGKLLKLLDNFQNLGNPHPDTNNYISWVYQVWLCSFHQFHSPAFKYPMGNVAKPLKTKHEYRGNKYGRLGRGSGYSLRTIFNTRCSDALWPLFYLLYFGFPSVFPSLRFLIQQAAFCFVFGERPTCCDPSCLNIPILDQCGPSLLPNISVRSLRTYGRNNASDYG